MTLRPNAPPLDQTRPRGREINETQPAIRHTGRHGSERMADITSECPADFIGIHTNRTRPGTGIPTPRAPAACRTPQAGRPIRLIYTFGPTDGRSAPMGWSGVNVLGWVAWAR